MHYQPMLSTVIESPKAEVIVSKQSALADHARETRSVLQALPPEVTRALLADYSLPDTAVVREMEAAVATRELALENATQEVGLDLEWLRGAAGTRAIDERNLGADDAWNTP